jgi:hypothetical protein
LQRRIRYSFPPSGNSGNVIFEPSQVPTRPYPIVPVLIDSQSQSLSFYFLGTSELIKQNSSLENKCLTWLLYKLLFNFIYKHLLVCSRGFCRPVNMSAGPSWRVIMARRGKQIPLPCTVSLHVLLLTRAAPVYPLRPVPLPRLCPQSVTYPLSLFVPGREFVRFHILYSVLEGGNTQPFA